MVCCVLIQNVLMAFLLLTFCRLKHIPYIGLIHLKLEIVEEPLYCLKFIENTYEKLRSDRVCKQKKTRTL
ncbi:hypothetical protein MtrunA17_Chr3g0118131 [Medicago truncatula]|uniref:Uncharacterized protein n=1 Tax=Medicago truncatula TaxID=3880 RepID=A0A396IWS0_MEDTR|nr:hypothetical protein MtrunA17_Chr3g0118131 [Medicago truncatula]